MAGPQKFWMVWNSNGKQPKKRYPTLVDASKDASELAVKQPGDKFYVLEALGYWKAAKGEGGAVGPAEMVTF